MSESRSQPLNCDRNAARWADEFNDVLAKQYNLRVDEGMLIGWFANAMMCGEDTYRWRREKEAQSEPPCATCNDDPDVCATVPGLRHCEAATRETPSEIEERKLRRAYDAAVAFIESHVADPDLTDEMTRKHAEYQEAKADYDQR